MKKVSSVIILILIFLGITMSILNFTTKAYSSPSAIFGTTTRVTNLLQQLEYYLEGRWLYDDYFCINEESDCAIVI